MAVAIAILLLSLLGCWWAFDYALEQLTFLGIGLGALSLSALVFGFGAIAVSYSTTGDEAELNVRPAPEPRWLTGSALAAVGAFMVLASTSSGVGDVFRPIGRLGMTTWDFGMAAWELLLTIALVGFAVAALFKRSERSTGFVLLGLIGFLALINLAFYLVAPGTFLRVWDEYWQPFRDMWQALQ